MIKTCMYCGKEFETNISNKKYCSVECRNKYCNRRQHKKIMARNIDNPTSNKNLEDWCLCAGEFGLNLLKEYSNKNSLQLVKYLLVLEIKHTGNAVNAGMNGAHL